MSKKLVVFFSAESERTKRMAEAVAEATGADLFEICPEQPYTKKDLNWKNPLARCNKEKFGKRDVPVTGSIENFGEYEEVLIGFPIWYGGAPNVVSSFCKGYDWSGKTVALFATSGMSGIGKSAEKLQPVLPGATIRDAKRFASNEEAAAWAKTLS